MKTTYMEIVNGNYIGSVENPVDLNEILKKADKEGLEPSLKDKERVLFLGIDVQQDFMDHGALGVAGAQKDVERMTRFIYDNIEKISNIAVSMEPIHHIRYFIHAGGLMRMESIPHHIP